MIDEFYLYGQCRLDRQEAYSFDQFIQLIPIKISLKIIIIKVFYIGIIRLNTLEKLRFLIHYCR